MDRPRYYKFDFDQGVVIEYERQGECCECGACCNTVIKWQGTNGGPKGIKEWNGGNGDLAIFREGVWTGIYIKDRWRFFKDMQITDEPHKCSMLTDDNRCKIHTGKRLISSAWPMLPDHVTPFAECSYTFTEVGRWTVAEYFSD